VATDFDRDDPIDRLLKGARRDGSAELVAGPACLDAEVLGAWADGALSADQRQSVEAHVADCARCQTLVATFAASEDAGGLPASAPAVHASAPAPVVPFRRSNIRVWLPIAAGTIAASLILTVVVRDREPAPSAVSADSKISAPAPQAQAGDATAQLQAKAEPSSRDLESARAAQTKPSAPKSGQRLDALETRARAERSQDRALARRVAEPPAAPLAKPVASAGGAMTAPPPPPAAVAAPPPPATPPPTPTPTPSVTVTSASPVARQVGQAGDPKSAANARDFMLGVADPTLVIAQFSSSDAQGQLGSLAGGMPDRAAGAGGAGGGRGGGGGAAAAREAPTFRSAVPPAHWRVMASGQVEKSADAKTWQPIRIDPPVQGLTGGTAPSPLVCWLIGRAGVVLVTTDGLEFRRVTSPTAANLTSIRATDALRATVTSADGQTFTTVDGGKTWKNN
jgi:hypothetical protein